MSAQPENVRTASLASSVEVYWLTVLVWSAWRAGRSKNGVLSGKPGYEAWSMLGHRLRSAVTMSASPAGLIDSLADRIKVRASSWYGQDTVLWLRAEAVNDPLAGMSLSRICGASKANLELALTMARTLHERSFASADVPDDEESTIAMMSEAQRVRLANH